MKVRDVETRRLYWQDPRAWDFEGRVVHVEPAPEGSWIVLDQTAFYPEAGGQMADRGTLAGLDVADVQVGEDGRIRHAVTGEPPNVGEQVQGRVDAERRVEHMALHTGQHALSAALGAHGGHTRSSRLGERGATLDIDPISAELIDRAEQEVNALIDEARVVQARFPSADELGKMDLRRTPKVDTGVRVIEIEGFDTTPCGGTHCANTSEIGLLRIIDYSKHKGGLRLVFSAGRRARRELAEESGLLRAMARGFTCGPADVPTAVAKASRELAETREALGLARAGWADAISASLKGSPSPIVAVLDGLDRAALGKVASTLANEGSWVVLAIPQGEAMHVLVEAGPGAGVDCREFFTRLAGAGGGRGGGRPQRAEGRFPTDVDLDALVAQLGSA